MPLQAHVAANKPVWAEGGGMVALSQSFTPTDGPCQPLWGLLPGHATQQRRLSGLGPQQLAWKGHTLRGHTFHYSALDTDMPQVTRTARPDQPSAPGAGEASGSCSGSREKSLNK